MPEPNQTPTSDRPSAVPPRSSNDWAGALLGLVLIGFGGYLLINSGGTSNFGLLMVLLGVAFQPWTIVSLVGGAALLVWAVWWTFFKAAYPMDYLYSAVAVIVGLGVILEKGRAMRRRK